ncbi:ATP synthase F0 subunit B [Candidatus Nomurabacteria bacterium RIFCSPLOWO2_01_FULL_40_15]|uniref:ATP synthase subunit b n=1 Tax=Candidatus Nomurabacteria bacterium RIFCSPLOWO2_01_FULL_40_15 TaxID=1801772 RepID=A0A1F6X5J5_9BACT|nr:MAG: ATP synthase F0 subunit B [Candidatus Nomurabacteria bacterium RIFCSPLOWO2_01_FULL_40_15]
MDSIISTFHIDWKIIIAQAVNFGIVFVVLYLFALKPLSKLMAERAEKIARGIGDAKSNAVILEKTKQEYEKVLIKARGEAQKIFEEGKKEAEKKGAVLLESAKLDVEGIIANGKKTLEAEKVKMVAEAKKEIVSLTMLTTERLLGHKLDESYDEKTIEKLSKN